jgi:hypothetical protein
MVTAAVQVRGQYGEIVLFSLPMRVQAEVLNLVNGAAQSAKVDEHGAWEFGAKFDRKGRGTSIKWDLYAVGRDLHSRRRLILIQIRRWRKWYVSGFPRILKSYFLIGRNEDDTIFAHCVSSRTVHRAINSGKDPIRAAQSWIFGCDYSKVLRQGDIGLVPVRRVPPSDSTATMEIVLQGSHQLTAATIIQIDNVLYAHNPYLRHLIK